MVKSSKILIVDDEEINTLQLEHILSDIATVKVCNISEDALNVIESYQPDILLLDLEMPKVNGFDILREVKGNESLTSMRVIVITAHTDAGTEELALSLGAIDFISKPLNLTLCKIKVHNHATLKQQQKALDDMRSALQSEKEYLRITLDSIADGVISTDKSAKITYMNPVAQRLTGWSQTAANGRHIEDVMRLSDATTLEPSINPLSLALEENRPVAMALNTQLISRQGITHRVEDSAAPIVDELGKVHGGVMVFQDVSETMALSIQMTYLSHHDQLTALPNRVLLHDRLAQGVARCATNNRKLSLLLLDLDNFKYLNDSLGHHVGDEIIAHIGHCLDTFATAEITVARVGGDEFAIIVPHGMNTFGLDAFIQQVLDVIGKPFRLADETHVLSASAGISVYPDDASSVEEMMRHADSAMYKAKQSPANSYCYFSDELQHDVDMRLSVGRTLRDALEHRKLEVHYQPKYCFDANTIIGVEGLVRLKDEEGNYIPPINFIEYAEESGLIHRLGEQVLEQCCLDAKSWLDAGYPMKVAVNVSAKQFRDSALVDIVAEVLERISLPSRYLELEVTESALIDSYTQTIAQLNTLSKMGISIALDDFGTGYSSLSYLRLFPLDVLKIDQSFVHEMLNDSQSLDIVNTIIHLAGLLGLQIVAEGIETIDQYNKLRELGCAVGQGYFLAKPMKSEHLIELVEKNSIPETFI